MDTIRIDALELDCIVGLRPLEREREQRVRLDLALGLDLSAAGKSGRIAQTLDYDEIAEEVVAQLRVTAREKNLRLILELENNLEPILGDEDQMQRALWNLVSNAIKFTPNGGSVSVVSETREKHVILQVKDTGTGIPQEELSSLFSEFRRLEGAVNTEGTGLGLFIVKTIVEVHGGTVTVQSTLGAGTTFTILLPRQTRKPESALRRAA